VRFGDLTFEEIRDAAQRGGIAIVPMGCIEQQGPHLPVDFDAWFAEALMVAGSDDASARHDVDSLVLPALPFGPTPEHVSFGSGFVDLPARLQEEVLTEILRSLASQGFQRLVVWRGCGGHDLRERVASLRREGMAVWLPEMPFGPIWTEVGGPDVGAGHADSFTTAVSLYLRPGSVRVDRVPGPSAQPDWSEEHLDFARYSGSGVIGDPRHGSAALGEKIWDRSVEWVGDYLREVHAS
jgi:creatinine amidohydrolase